MTNDNLSDLGDLGKLPHLSDAISYENDIAPYRFIEIFAGVGSGKNKLINRFVNGDTEKEIPKKIVLVITSRRSKVNELLADKEAKYAARVGKWGNMTQDLYDADDWERFKDNIRIIKDEWGEHPFYQKSVACTNAFIEKYIQNVYDPSDPGTHLWNLFDIIVVDEYHAMVTDAGYQTAPYYVNSLVWEIAYRHKMADDYEKAGNTEFSPTAARPLCKHLILMTGTPETVRKYPVRDFEPHVLDMMKKCVNVVPKNIWFLDMKQAKKLIEEKISAGKRCLYFPNHVLFPDEFCKRTTISPYTVAISFSDAKRRDSLAACAQIPVDKRTEDEQRFAQIYNNMVEVEKSISTSGHIPPQFRLWITTSRNKEGINIHDTDINDVFLESHCTSDIRQMAGRVRHGAENLYIIVDSPGYNDDGYRYENVLSKDGFAPDIRKIKADTDLTQWTLNFHLWKLCNSRKIPDFFANRNSEFRPFAGKANDVRKYIKFVHDKLDYVRFDPFRNHFCFYYLKEVAKKYDRIQHRKFWEASQDHSKYTRLFQEIFPTATVHPYKDRDEQMREYLDELLKSNPYRTFSAGEIEAHKAHLNQLKFDSPDDYLQKMNVLLKPLGYQIRRSCKDRSKPGYERWRYFPLEPDQQAS